MDGSPIDLDGSMWSPVSWALPAPSQELGVPTGPSGRDGSDLMMGLGISFGPLTAESYIAQVNVLGKRDDDDRIDQGADPQEVSHKRRRL